MAGRDGPRPARRSASPCRPARRSPTPEALAEVGVHRPAATYWAGRATLVRRPEDVPAYDRAFARRVRRAARRTATGGRRAEPSRHVAARRRRATPPADGGRRARTARRAERPRRAVERPRGAPRQGLRRAARPTSSTRPTGSWPTSAWSARPPRRSRRRRPAPPAAGRPTCGARSGGRCAPAASRCRTVHRGAGERPRRLVLLCRRVAARWSPTPGRWSASPTPPWSAGAARSRCSPSAPGCTRVTRELSARTIPTPPSTRPAGAVADWSGGTRLGEGLRTFNDRWGVRGLARGAVVVILSDGWDRGDPEVLGRADAPPAAGRPPRRVGEPAQGDARLRAAGPGHGRGAAARRRVRRGPLAGVARGAGRGDRARSERDLLDDLDRWREAGQAGRRGPGRRPRGLGPPRPGRGDGRQRATAR